MTVFPKEWTYATLCLCFYRAEHSAANSLWLEGCRQSKNLFCLALGQNSRARSEGQVATKINIPMPYLSTQSLRMSTTPNTLRSKWRARREQRTSQTDLGWEPLSSHWQEDAVATWVVALSPVLILESQAHIKAKDQKPAAGGLPSDLQILHVLLQTFLGKPPYDCTLVNSDSKNGRNKYRQWQCVQLLRAELLQLFAHIWSPESFASSCPRVTAVSCLQRVAVSGHTLATED